MNDIKGDNSRQVWPLCHLVLYTPGNQFKKYMYRTLPILLNLVLRWQLRIEYFNLAWDLTVPDTGLKISVNKGFDFFSADLFSCFDSYVTPYWGFVCGFNGNSGLVPPQYSISSLENYTYKPLFTFLIWVRPIQQN